MLREWPVNRQIPATGRSVPCYTSYDVSDEENKQVTVRRLPDGVAQTASVQSFNGQLMRLNREQFPGDAVLKAGDLVEVTSPGHLYLGEVLARQAETIAVRVEHGLDRAALALIQQVWQSPAAD